jgi:triphosphoribosyl-dephospho-CoA synthase
MIGLNNLGNNLRKVIEHSTYNDSIDLYRAINLSMNLNTLGTVDELDVNDLKSFQKIELDMITPREIFEICAHRDLICKEWVTNFHVTFNMGYPNLKSNLKILDTNSAILESFLFLLSKFPDSLITRKSGVVKAEEVSNRAREILKIGGTSSKDGMRMIWEFDDELHSKDGALNPGTIADLTAASIFVTLLEGWKP